MARTNQAAAPATLVSFLASVMPVAGMLIMRLEVHVFNILFFAGEIQHAVTSLGRAEAGSYVRNRS